MPVLASVRANDDESVAVLEVCQGNASRLATTSAAGGQEQYRHAGECCAQSPAAYPVSEPMKPPNHLMNFVRLTAGTSLLLSVVIQTRIARPLQSVRRDLSSVTSRVNLPPPEAPPEEAEMEQLVAIAARYGN